MSTPVRQNQNRMDDRARIGAGSVGLFVTTLVALVVIGGFYTGSIRKVLAHENETTGLASMPMGQVRDLFKHAEGYKIQIDDHIYIVHPAIMITDGQGNPRELNDLQKGFPVRYRLKSSQVDLIVIVLPP